MEIIFYKRNNDYTPDVIDKIMRHFITLYSKENYTKYKNLSIFTLCAICHKYTEELEIYEDYLVCNACDPKDYDEDKMRAWLRLDR